MKTTRELMARSRIGTVIGNVEVDYTFPTGRGTWEYGCTCHSCNRAGLVMSWKEIDKGECPDCITGTDRDFKFPPISKREQHWQRVREEERALDRKYYQLEALFEGV